MFTPDMINSYGVRTLARRVAAPLVTGCLFTIAGAANATPVPLAIDPLNVADDGVASVYETSGGGLVTSVAYANDTEYSGDIANNLMTITGEWLGIQIDLAGTTHLTELGAYVDPAGGGSDPYKSTDAVEFFISTNSGASYSSLGFGAFTAAALDNFSYVNVVGSFTDVTNVRYRFHQADFGREGQRIPELLAFSVPEPSSLALMGIALAGFGFSARRKREA